MNGKNRISGIVGKGAFIIGAAIAFFSASPLAVADMPKRLLRDDMTEVYHMLPEESSFLAGAFGKGMFYGRLRMNYFYWDYDEEMLHDPIGFGLGGSLIYKTAPYAGFSLIAGLYTSQNLGLLDMDDALFGRTGKGTFCRYHAVGDGDWGISVLAQAYIQYHVHETDIKVGRQVFEGFLARSNDTKMIPNTFEGVTLISRDLPDTTFTAAFFTGQKLRDHAEYHDVITYNDGRNRTVTVDSRIVNLSDWNNQDDSGSHRGLSFDNLKVAGKKVDNTLVIAGVTNQSIDHVRLDLWYTGVPELFYSLMGEANVEIPMPGGWSLTPGLRYMRQFDDGAGVVGGAALNGKLVDGTGLARGYNDPDCVDGELYAVRLVLKKGAGKLHAGYSNISDDADFIAPWRGFPTGGYTRSMGQYNWFADTDSWMIQAYYDFGKADIIQGLRGGIDYVWMDYGDEKERLGGHSFTDRSYIHADIWYVFPFFDGLEAKFRFGIINADHMTNATAIAASGEDPSYHEFRFELNYLF
jgi:hypothetical protein